jgi:hypothetical protein
MTALAMVATARRCTITRGARATSHEARMRDVFGQVACLLVIGVLGTWRLFLLLGFNAASLTPPLYVRPRYQGRRHKIIVTFLQMDDQNGYPEPDVSRTAQLTTNVLAACSVTRAGAKPRTLRSLRHQAFRARLLGPFLPAPFINFQHRHSVLDPPTCAGHAAISPQAWQDAASANLITGFQCTRPPAGSSSTARATCRKTAARLRWSAQDRLVILDPEDAEPPALNFFQLA